MAYKLSTAMSGVKTQKVKFTLHTGKGSTGLLAEVLIGTKSTDLADVQKTVGNTNAPALVGVCYRGGEPLRVIFLSKAEVQGRMGSFVSAMKKGGIRGGWELKKAQPEDPVEAEVEGVSTESESSDSQGEEMDSEKGQQGSGQGQQGQRPMQPRPQTGPVNPTILAQRQQGSNNPGPVRPVNPVPVRLQPGVVPIRVPGNQIPPNAIPVRVVNPPVQVQPTRPIPQQPQGNPGITRKPARIFDPQTQGVPVQPQGIPTRARGIPVPSQRPARVVPSDPAGVGALAAKTASALGSAKGLADEVTKTAFRPGQGQRCAVMFATKPVEVKREVFSKLNKELDGYYKDIIKNAPTEKDKAARLEFVKGEQTVAASMDAAMKNFQEKKGEAFIAPLEKACTEAFTVYEKSFTAKVNRANRQIETTTNQSKIEGLKQEKEEWFKSPQAARLLASADALLEVKLLKNKKLAADLSTAMAATENDKTEANVAKVQALADEYLGLYKEHAAAYAKVPGHERTPNAVGQEALAELIREQAEKTLFSLKQERLGPPPWAEDKQQEGNDLLDLGRQIKAKAVLAKGRKLDQKGGGSDVLVIGDPNGKVEFAFKNAAAENSEMGLPKGSGAIREAVTSKVMDAVLQQTGFDFGFPQATIATIQGKSGALIEGIVGRELPAEDKIKPEEKEEIAKFQNEIPGKQLQKTLCAGFITGNFLDQKWDNVFWEGEGANANARPFDAGAGFLPTKNITEQMTGFGGERGFVLPLLKDAKGQPTKGASDPMDDEIVGAMLKIDLVAMEKTIDDETQRHAASGLGQLLDGEAKKNGLKTLAAAQKVLKGYENKLAEAKKLGNGVVPKRPSLIEFADDMQKALVEAFPTEEELAAKRTV